MMALWLMAGLLVKHFICDYPLQLPYMLKEKGTYGEKGGIHHALFHGAGTALVFVLFGMAEIAAVMAILDILIHYHVDFLKMKINSWAKLKPDNNRFWHLIGLDQLVHQLTYVLLVALAVAKYS
jgi:hypothetical protein